MSELVSIRPLVDNNDAFGVQDDESVDSLEAITKQDKKKKSFKYKMMMKGQRKGTKHVEAEEEEEEEEVKEEDSIPVLRPIYVTNYVEKYASAERMAPFRKFEREESQNDPPQRKPQADSSGHKRNKKHTSSQNDPPHRKPQADSSGHKSNKKHASTHPKHTSRCPSPLTADRLAPFRKFETEESQKHPPQRKHQVDSKRHTLSRPSPLTLDPNDHRESELLEQRENEEQSSIKRSNKYSSRLSKVSPHPSYDTKTASSVNKSNGSGSNKYSLTLSRHRRTVQLEKEEKEREQKAASLREQLLADGEFYLRSPSATSTQYFSALSHSFQNSRTGFSLESSKKSHMSSSLASSIDVGASPDEIIAFGSVVDHLTKGGSIRNANKIFQKELRMLGKYRDEDPIEASYNKALLQKKAYECDEESIEVLHEDDAGTVDHTLDHTVDDTVHDSDAIEFDEDSVPTFKFDKYLAKFVEPEEDLTFEDEGDGDEEENDWCVPDPTDKEDEATVTVADAVSVDAGDSYTHDNSLETGDEYSTDSSCDSGSYESDSDSGAFTFEDDDSSSFQCDSTITSYVSTRSLSKKSKPNKSKTKKDKKKKKKKDKKKKKKKRNFLSILKGKKRSKETTRQEEMHSEEKKVEDSNVIQVDRLPDSFEDENDENTNIVENESNPKREHKKNDKATAEKTQRLTPESAIREVVNYALELAANQISDDDETEDSQSRTTKGAEGGSVEQQSLESIRVLAEIPFGPPSEKYSLETMSSSVEGTTSSLKTMDILKDAAAKKNDQGVLIETLNEAGCAVPEELPTIANLVLVDTADALMISDALGMPGAACFDNKADEDDSNHDDENNSICGASLSMESIMSLDAPSVIGSLIEDAAQFTNDSMRSARSIFFSDDVGDELGMTAADDFEEQLKSMEDPEDSNVPTSTTTEEPKTSLEDVEAKPFVPEYADCDEGLEDDAAGASAKKTPKAAPNTSTSTNNKTKKPKVKRRRSFFKRSASSERGKLSKEAPPVEDKDDDVEESDYEVDIVVYSRDKLPADTVGLSESTFVNPKPLMDDTDEGDAQEEESPPPPPAPTTTTTATTKSMTAHDLMAAEYAQTSSEEVLAEILHKAATCCGGVAATGNQMMERGQHMMETLPQIAAVTAQGAAAESMVANFNLWKATQQQEGQIVSSFPNTSEDADIAAIASFPTDEVLSTEELPIEWVLSDEEKKARRKRSIFGRKKK